METKFGGIWVGEKDLTNDPVFIAEAQSEIQNNSLVETLGKEGAADNLGGNRRDFLRFLGFGVGAAAVAAGCDIPVKRAIPYTIKPEEIIPGVATYYASTYVDGGDYCSILVKTREGRPIKIEGNKMSPISKGGTSARVQASVLGLYDLNRLKNPTIGGAETTWSALDQQVKSILASSKGARILTHTILSPTAKRALAILQAKYPSIQVITYDPVSSSAILAANEKSFGDRVIPNYHFDKASTIVSFNADFLGTWISPIEYAADYAVNRKITDVNGAKMSYHVQVEAHMSLTGSNADNRILVKPSEQGAAIALLYNSIVGGASAASVNEKAASAIKKLASKLKASPGNSLIVSSSNNVTEQMMINAINQSLGNYGSTISFDHASLQRQGDERGLVALVNDIKSGLVDTVIFHKCNPVYEYGAMPGLKDALNAAKNKIAMTYDNNESSAISTIVAPVNHYLESWGDAEAKRGLLSIIQPTISPLFDTRQSEVSFLTWADYALASDQGYYGFLKQSWELNTFKSQSEFLGFGSFWDNALHNGVTTVGGVNYATNYIAGIADGIVSKPTSSELEIVFIEPVTIGNGQFSNNPWLQEMPDPVSRCTWGNYLAIPVEFDGNKKFNALNGLKDGDLVEVKVGAVSYTVPVIQQFGQMKGTVALALGYGREVVGFAGNKIGVNTNASVGYANGLAQYFAGDVTVSKKLKKEEHFSCVQYHNTMGITAPDAKTGEIINADETALAPGYGNIAKGFQGALVERSIIRHSNVSNLKASVAALHKEREEFEELNQKTLYPYDQYVAEKYSQGHWWGMHVDLNACTGCGACTIACMAENNIPVVGKSRVAKHQEMSWLRIDRYYYGDVENPNVVFQPMMCQHCDNAPCENVCPVNATSHSSEGLNQMTYNRCIGTRYCANNCPYKVRRFNWMDYTTADLFPVNAVRVNGETTPYGVDDLTRMVLNPDVTVRSRGVIEKCSFCVQRLQEGKLTAKKEGRNLKDSDVSTACQTACPTGAITFGDRNNKEGELYKKFESPINMIVLEEINVRSSVQYTMKINNRDKSLDA